MSEEQITNQERSRIVVLAQDDVEAHLRIAFFQNGDAAGGDRGRVVLFEPVRTLSDEEAVEAHLRFFGPSADVEAHALRFANDAEDSADDVEAHRIFVFEPTGALRLASDDDDDAVEGHARFLF
jgi:hypothetical protein